MNVNNNINLSRKAINEIKQTAKLLSENYKRRKEIVSTLRKYENLLRKGLIKKEVYQDRESEYALLMRKLVRKISEQKRKIFLNCKSIKTHLKKI